MTVVDFFCLEPGFSVSVSVSVCGDSPEIFIYRNHEWLTAPKFFGLRWSTERTFIDSFFSSKHNFPTQPSWNPPPLFDWEQVVLKRNEEISHKEKSELVFFRKKNYSNRILEESKSDLEGSSTSSNWPEMAGQGCLSFFVYKDVRVFLKSSRARLGLDLQSLLQGLHSIK